MCPRSPGPAFEMTSDLYGGPAGGLLNAELLDIVPVGARMVAPEVVASTRIGDVARDTPVNVPSASSAVRRDIGFPVRTASSSFLSRSLCLLADSYSCFCFSRLDLSDRITDSSYA